MTRSRLVAALALALAAAAASPAAAALYTYTDENGVTHYTNQPSDPRFRKAPGSPPPPAAASQGGAVGERAVVNDIIADAGVNGHGHTQPAGVAGNRIFFKRMRNRHKTRIEAKFFHGGQKLRPGRKKRVD